MNDQEYKGFVIHKDGVDDYYWENPLDRDEHGFERSIFECKREIDFLLDFLSTDKEKARP